jgi:hypothetical protein
MGRFTARRIFLQLGRILAVRLESTISPMTSADMRNHAGQGAAHNATARRNAVGT